jgi:hypothetical protein
MPTLTATDAALVSAPARVKSSVSWVSHVVIFAATSIVVGILWDISWHRTIGRDTFWTPAHLAIYLGGVLGGCTAGWLVLKTTFFSSTSEKAAAVRILGMYGPIGAWVSIWGALAMLTSAPFDDWWHNAYGLDVRIISPPHTVLAFGMWAVVGGALLLVLREQNNAAPGETPRGRSLFVYAAGVLLAMESVFLIEASFPNHQHSHRFYIWSASTYPLFLIGVSRATKFRFGATFIALIYMLIIAGMAWVLPLFAGEPKLGPVNHRVSHFVPLPFPLVLVAPALLIDLIRHGIGHARSWWRDWLIVIACSAAFVAVFAIVQWNFSKFLLTPAADNWFFAADRHWGYMETPGPWTKQFWDEGSTRWGRGREHSVANWYTWTLAFVCAVVASRVGLWLGNWMAKVQR